MTPRQRIAIEHPCKFAVQTMHERYNLKHRSKSGRLVSTTLTLNNGYE